MYCKLGWKAIEFTTDILRSSLDNFNDRFIVVKRAIIDAANEVGKLFIL